MLEATPSQIERTLAVEGDRQRPGRFACFAALVKTVLFVAMAGANAILTPPALAAEVTRAQCFPARGPIVIDGDLTDWDRRAPLRVEGAEHLAKEGLGGAGANVPPTPAPPAATGVDTADASLVAYLEWDYENLYIAGEVRDDSRVFDDRLWFNGDCIELLLDTARKADLDQPLFDADDYEICLMPYNSGRSWGVLNHGRQSVLSDGGLQGVVVAARPTSAAGYVFEARFPWRNFPSVDPEHPDLAINLALIDCDRKANDKETAVERTFLLLHPENFAYLTTRGMVPLECLGEPWRSEAPAARDAGSRLGIWLLEILIALVLIAVVARYAEAVFHSVERALRRAKSALAIASGLLLVLLVIGPFATTRFLEMRGRDQFEDAVRAVGRVVGALSERDAVGSATVLHEPGELVSLLRGRALPAPPEYDYAVIDLLPLEQAKNFKRSKEGVPVREYGFPLAPQRQYYFPLARPTVLSRLFVFGHARFEAAARDRPGASPLREQALEIGVRLADGRLRTEVYPVVDRSSPAGASVVSTERFASGYDGESGPVDQYFLGAPTISNTLVQAVVVTLRDPAVQFDLDGVTCAPQDSADQFVPLPLIRASLAGPPAAAWNGIPRGAELAATLDPSSSSKVVRIGQRLDALWFFYDSSDPRALDPALRGVEVGRFVARDSSGREYVTALHAGVNLFNGQYDAVKRPSDTDSHVAFRYTTALGATRSVEMLEMKFTGSPVIEEVRFENRGPLASISLHAVTGGLLSRSQTAAPPGTGLTFVGGPGELRVAADLTSTLDDCGILVLAGDTVAASDFLDDSRSKAMLGAKPPFGEEVEGAGPDGASSREDGQRIVLFAEPFRTRSFELPRADGATWRAVLFTPVRGVSLVARVQRQGFFLLILLGLPLLVLFALDFGTRIARLGPRLTTLLVATSLTPIVVLFAVLYNFVAQDRARIRESRVDVALREIQRRFEQVYAQTRQVAEQIASSDVMKAVRPDLPIDESVIRSYLSDVVAVHSAGNQGLDLAARLEIDAAGGHRARYHDRAEAESMSRFDLAGRGAFVHWDRLDLLWTQDFSVGAAHRKVTVAGEIQPAFVRELSALADVDVALLALNGRPLADSRLLDARFAASDVDKLRRVNHPVFENRSDGALVATSLLFLGDGEPSALVQIGIPPDEFLIDVVFAKLPLESFFFWFCVVGLSAAVFMGSIATSRITGPIEQLERAVRRIAEGELDVQVDAAARGRGEVARLATSFNDMARELHTRASERRRFERAVANLNASIDVEPTASAALAVLAEDAVVSVVAVFVRDSEQVTWLRRGTNSRLDPAAPAEIKEARLFDYVARRKEPLLCEGVVDPSIAAMELTPYERRIIDPSPALVLPLTVSDRCIGVAVIKYAAGTARSAIEAELATLVHLAGQIAVSLENAKLYQLAVADPETGLYVESFFKSRFAEEVDRAQRRESKLALLLVAVDGLRRLERSQGREAVRETVVRLARFLKSVSRDMVLVGRLPSGFALLSPETDRSQADDFRLRVLREFAALDGGDFVLQTGIHLHIGVAVFPGDGASSAYLFDAATRAIAASRRARVSEALATPQGASGAPEIDPHPYVFSSPVMKDLLSQVARVAASTASVLVLGETGTGKEVIAELLHRFSDRAHKPFVAINCSAMPENLLESELFGYERGAFTGAIRAKPGQFELADGGTLFLDEIGDLPLPLQAKLLRVLQDRLVVRLGARKGTEVDVRIVAATNRDLREMMEQGRFRADLYFRLKVVTLSLPALRERREDIPLLVEGFVRQFNEESGRPPKTMSTAALDHLYGYSWPGNVRELRNVVSRALLMSEGDLVLPAAIEFDRPRSEAGGRGQTTSEARGGDGHAISPRTTGEGSGPTAKEIGTESPSSQVGADGLNERQRRLLAALERGQTIRSREYFTMVQVSPRTGLRDLTDLVSKGLIVRDGHRRAAAYRLPGGETAPAART